VHGAGNFYICGLVRSHSFHKHVFLTFFLL
jgi:hypothetical protein